MTLQYSYPFKQINISVQDPQLDTVGGFTTYLITGTDKLGQFEIRRRYNDFYTLRFSKSDSDRD
jgi:hypothetical protein